MRTLSNSNSPPKFVSLDLDAEVADSLVCQMTGHRWLGKLDIRATGELRLVCEECGKIAICTCCGETDRSLEGDNFVCGCIWKPEQLFSGHTNSKCSLHADYETHELVMPVAGHNIQAGQLVFQDDVTGYVYSAAEMLRQGLALPAPLGVVSHIDRVAMQAVVKLNKK